MQVNLLLDYEVGVESLIIPYSNVREILSYLKFIKGQEIVDEILGNEYAYLVQKEGEEPIELVEEVILSDLSQYDSLYILKAVNGAVPVAAVAGLFYGFGAAGTAAFASAGAWATVGVYALAATINIGLSIALQYLMNALSPTPHTSDPVQAQTNVSNLFNGARIINEQGGVVPLAYGECFAGGTLISSSVTTIQG